MKTVRKEEMKLLLGRHVLQRYTEHLTAHPAALLTRFYGVHRVTPLIGRRVRGENGGSQQLSACVSEQILLCHVSHASWFLLVSLFESDWAFG